MAFTLTKLRVFVALIIIIFMYLTCKLFIKTYVKEVRIYHPIEGRSSVQVAVFYEALCPDSKHFFIHHLEFAYAKLKDNISINLVPYGKAKTMIGPDGELNFECQHGELECFANKIHACAIDNIPDTEEQLTLISCMIKDNMDPEGALNKCASSGDITSIIDCAKGSAGSELLKKHGDDTKAIKPSFIPTIYINGSKGDQASLLKHFLLEVCKYFPMAAKPAPCL